MCEEPIISPIDLPPRFLTPPAASSRVESTIPGASPVQVDFSQPFYQAVENFERAYLSQAYRMMDGNVSRMSTDLQMDRSYLHRKLKNYGIHGSKLN
jgi:two-component system nitrogen regulation response regulator NtrX